MKITWGFSAGWKYIYYCVVKDVIFQDNWRKTELFFAAILVVCATTFCHHVQIWMSARAPPAVRSAPMCTALTSVTAAAATSLVTLTASPVKVRYSFRYSFCIHPAVRWPFVPWIAPFRASFTNIVERDGSKRIILLMLLRINKCCILSIL